MQKIDFIIAGTQKSGTTWLQRRLRDHPLIGIGENEINYFNYNYNRGVDWYNKIAVDRTKKRIYGEKSPEYFRLPFEGVDVAARIKAYNPKMKIILVLRDPRSRAVSALKHHIRMGRIFPGFSLGYILRNKHSFLSKWQIINYGFYSQIYDYYLSQFDESQIHICFYEDIVSNEQGIIDGITEFLGVPKFIIPRLGKKENAFNRDIIWLILNWTNPTLARLYWYLKRTKRPHDFKLDKRAKSYLNEVYRGEISLMKTRFNIPKSWNDDFE